MKNLTATSPPPIPIGNTISLILALIMVFLAFFLFCYFNSSWLLKTGCCTFGCCFKTICIVLGILGIAISIVELLIVLKEIRIPPTNPFYTSQHLVVWLMLVLDIIGLVILSLFIIMICVKREKAIGVQP